MRTSVHSPGKPVPNLIVMLTYHDVTVSNAAEVFELCKDTRAQYWGIKEEGLPLEEMQALFRRMKDCGKITCLEVVAYIEAEGLRGAEIAAACGWDLLMGTVFSDPIHAFCQAHSLRYLPFVGQVTGRPFHPEPQKADPKSGSAFWIHASKN